MEKNYFIKLSKNSENIITFAHKLVCMKVVIIGGGFAGLKVAYKLRNKKGVEVLLIDKNNYHQFQPLFYQVATAGLDASNISFPLRKAIQKSNNIRFRLANVTSIDSSSNKIKKIISSVVSATDDESSGKDTVLEPLNKTSSKK